MILSHLLRIMKKTLQLLLESLYKFIGKSITYLNSAPSSALTDKKLNIFNVDYNESGRFLIFYLHNEQLYDRIDSLEAIFNSLMSDDRFLNFGKKKIIITTAYINKTDFSFHHNILLTNEIQFKDYFNKVIDIVEENYEDNYPVDVIPVFKVRV
jgi:TnpA family transposase